MAPEEQDGAAAQQESPPSEEKKKESPKLGNLSAVEKVVNFWAKPIAQKHRVNEDQYTIVLSSNLAGAIWGIRRGPVAQIVIQWPEALPNINTILGDAFKVIARHKMVDAMSVESVFLIRKRADDRRKLIRKQIGNDESDIILDLVPKHRIVTTVTTSVEYKDVITGETYTVTHKEKPEHYRGQDVSSWLKLSRIVRDNHPEEATRYDNTGTVTPQAEAPQNEAGA
jgi:hypothetical protein